MFCEVDETHIPVYRIVHQGKDIVGDGAQEDHRYPFAGAENARVRVGVVPSDGSGRDEPSSNGSPLVAMWFRCSSALRCTSFAIADSER